MRFFQILAKKTSSLKFGICVGFDMLIMNMYGIGYFEKWGGSIGDVKILVIFDLPPVTNKVPGVTLFFGMQAWK